jgi:hypothetical protein
MKCGPPVAVFVLECVQGRAGTPVQATLLGVCSPHPHPAPMPDHNMLSLNSRLGRLTETQTTEL